jgi:hypothetical protein
MGLNIPFIVKSPLVVIMADNYAHVQIVLGLDRLWYG